MKARAAATDATRERIAEAAKELFLTRWYDEVSVRDIASEAGVAVQTVVNHFGTKDAVFAAGFERLGAEIQAGRARARPDDARTAAAAVADDYERTGDAILRSLALEERVPDIRAGLELGRQSHRAWVERAFPGAIKGLGGAVRERRVTQLVVATDVFTWKLLRRDASLSRRQTAVAMQELVEALYPRTKGPAR